MNKILVVLISVIALFMTSCQNDNMKVQSEEKVYSNVTMEDNIEDDVILITLNKENPTNFRSWDIGDFREISDVESVQELTSGMTWLAQKQIEAQQTD